MPEIIVSQDRNVLDPRSVSFEERARQLEEENKRAEAENKRQKNSPYSTWYQFNRDHTADMIWLTKNHPKAQVVLWFLLDQMDDYNAVMCSYKVLEEALDMSHATVARAVRVLKDRGYLAILKSGTSNVYVVNKDLAWGSWGRNFKYCKFPANVVLSATENEEYLKTLKEVKSTKIKTVEVKENQQSE